MKKLFYIGLILLALFEIMNVYFIMPMPGSQYLNSLDLAYFLHSFRWIFRSLFGLMVLSGAPFALKTQKVWIPIAAMVPVVVVTYLVNFKMTADHMFLQPVSLEFVSRKENTLTDSSLVIAVTNAAEAKAYPVRYIQYHHQVRDTIAGKSIMVTYCNVCRTGRVFEPIINGKPESFRLVGMNHFNAMFEDETTKSWWRQATGEAVTGSLKGTELPEVMSNQYTLGKFFQLHPFGKVMCAEADSKEHYDTLGRFEKGKSKNKLTRTDSVSWNDKSWVIGIDVNGHSKAYAWNDLKVKRIINDQVGSTPVVVAIASDNQSFVAIERGASEEFILKGDSLISNVRKVDFAGRTTDGPPATILKTYQEFWHSWKQFHPKTEAQR